ncbi:hypothetical protein [Gilliamella sp. wkB112]|uniref:hypothetical protein n=1 Tax=Gilliamella sp. wkB112 TaxID=3120257 RepID=UPI0011473EA8|nr:hypothetical protein [Gilliamella apicola]
MGNKLEAIKVKQQMDSCCGRENPSRRSWRVKGGCYLKDNYLRPPTPRQTNASNLAGILYLSRCFQTAIRLCIKSAKALVMLFQ